MATLIHDARLEMQLRQQRVAAGADRYDEVWEDVYVMAPMPDHEHQRLVARFTRVLDEIITDGARGVVLPGVNVSDRVENWESNYRVPDVAVFLNETKATNHRSFWHGGPDFAIEITSPNDETRKKLDFYGSVGTRELLIVDRDPWQLELFRLANQRLHSQARRRVETDPIECESVTVEFQLRVENGSPRICARDLASDRQWVL